MIIRNQRKQNNFLENKHNFVVNTVSADGLAPLGAMTYADTVMCKLCPCVYTYGTRASSQYKDRLIYVWRFPC